VQRQDEIDFCCCSVWSRSRGPWNGPSVCQQSILIFCLLDDTRRLYGFRQDDGISFALMDQKGKGRIPVQRTFRPAPWRGGLRWLSPAEFMSPARIGC
jgi:hypothetical protein